VNKRLTSALIPTLFAMAFLVPMAAPAQAATADPASITATRSGVLVLDLSAADLVANVGDTFTLINASDTNLEVFDDSGSVTAGGTSCPFTSVCTVLAGGSQVFVITQLGFIGARFLGGSPVAIRFADRGAVLPPELLPQDVLQQVGRSAMGCATFTDDSLNWAGVDGDGWGESWALWANGGNGGAVCTRTLTYSRSLNRWTVLR
jgi:hypothetical protein